MNGKIPAIIDGGECSVGLESTVVSVKDGVVTMLRPGGVTVEDLESVCENVVVCDAVLNKLKEGETALSPGMKYKHYSPNARVCLVKLPLEICTLPPNCFSRSSTTLLLAVAVVASNGTY